MDNNNWVLNNCKFAKKPPRDGRGKGKGMGGGRAGKNDGSCKEDGPGKGKGKGRGKGKNRTAQVSVNPFASVYISSIEELDRLEEKLQDAIERQEAGHPKAEMLVRFYKKRVEDQERVVEGAKALMDTGEDD